MSLSLTKMAVLTGYANTISLKEFAKNRLFLATPAGMISGIPYLMRKIAIRTLPLRRQLTPQLSRPFPKLLLLKKKVRRRVKAVSLFC